MTARLAIIAPYIELRKVAQAAVDELGSEIIIEEGDLADGLEAARRSVARGAEVIISRGGTAVLIAENLDVPVVEIQVSPYDILRCLYQLRNFEGAVGIVGFRNVVYGCESLGNILGISIRQIVIESPEDAQEKIAAAARDGIRMIIGDAVSVKAASKVGLEGMLIVSGKEAVVAAIEEAKKVADVRARERERSELLRVVVSNSHDGIIAIDQDERITLFNPAAEQIFGIKAEDAIGSKVTDKIPNTQLPRVLNEGRSEFSILQNVNDKVIVTQRFAVKVNDQSVAAIANFQDVTELQRLEQIVRQKMNAKGLVAKTKMEDLIGQSQTILDLKKKAKKFASVDAAVLICGESGTGKEMLAQSIHNLGRRVKGPFVAVNCAALPESLLESELFGYEEGAFTGARKGGKQGLFELAHGGTILLDEIGEVSLKLQAQLLRVLQEREIMRVGGDRIIPIDVRLITSTNRNLQELIGKGKFRDDLYYRIAVLKLQVPPLRERKSDIPLLVEFFLNKHSRSQRKSRGLESKSLKQLQEYDWPGNVRELELVIQRLLVLSEGETINPELVGEVLQELESEGSQPNESGLVTSGRKLVEIEAELIAAVLAEEGHNVTRAAKRLGIDRATLRRKLRGDANNSGPGA